MEDILLKILVYGTISPVDARYEFVHQNELSFSDGIDDFCGMFSTFQEMWDDDVMGVSFFSVPDEFPEKAEIVVVDVEIDGGMFAECSGECIIDDFFMGTEFIEQQEYPDEFLYFGVRDKIAFPWDRAYDALFFELPVSPFSRVPGDAQLKAEVVDGWQDIILPDMPVFHCAQDRVCDLQVFRGDGLFVNQYMAVDILRCHDKFVDRQRRRPLRNIKLAHRHHNP
jgi:hypothetical protein